MLGFFFFGGWRRGGWVGELLKTYWINYGNLWLKSKVICIPGSMIFKRYVINENIFWLLRLIKSEKSHNWKLKLSLDRRSILELSAAKNWMQTHLQFCLYLKSKWGMLLTTSGLTFLGLKQSKTIKQHQI